ncbi:TIGR01777 family oxidoreductase [bacterium]|nr:TIGR01777 family oxidoreductase [bacterium]
MKILVTGGTGFIGKVLCEQLGVAGHQLRVLSRKPGSRPAGLRSAEMVAFPPLSDAALWQDAVRDCDAIVNLAGESIAEGRWTEARKKALHDSRVATTRALVDACAAIPKPPQVLVSGSAIGFYGPHGDEPLDEASPAGSDFLARICVDWEAEARRAEALGTRVVLLRIGIVLGPDGGALAKMLPPFKMFAGGPLGSGKQWMSWVHVDDVCGMIAFALGHPVAGPMNATAPDPKTMGDFAKTLGSVLGRPSWMPVPAPVLRIALGEMSEMLLNGQRVLPKVAEAAGYRFRHPTLVDALRAAVSA